MIDIAVRPVLSRALLLAAAMTCGAQAEETAPPKPLGTVTNSIGMKLVLLPAGRFRMGSPPGEVEREPEEVLHPVTIEKPFYIGAHEVTQAEFARIMGTEQKPFFNAERGGGPDHPMEDLRWRDADAFCRKLSELPEEAEHGRRYRLPTEAEWEYACRAGTTTAFQFGDALSSRQANFNGAYPYGGAEKGPYLRKTAKVGSYEPNAFGLYDMHGNVAEWCADWYDPEWYTKREGEGPQGPPEGVVEDDYGNPYRAVRGGSWLDDARACRSAYRQRAMHRNTYRLIGFRVVCEVDAETERE